MPGMNINYRLVFIASCIFVLVMVCNQEWQNNFKPIAFQTPLFQLTERIPVRYDDHEQEEERQIDVGCRKDFNNKSHTICEKLKYSIHKEFRSGYNEAVVAYGSCVADQPYHSSFSEKEKIIWVTNFIDFRLEKYRANMGWNLDDVQFSDKPSNVSHAVEARMFEIIGALKMNLQHQMIEKIHILIHDWETVLHLRKLDLPNTDRLVLQFVNESVTMNSQFLYAMRCLKDRIVAISNQDNMMGEGWDRLKPDSLRKHKTLYALTRSPSFNTSCFVSAGYTCKAGGGSHDTFVLHARPEITAEKMKRMNSITANTRGMEHVLIWIFRKELGYTVLNPCLTLLVHHQHCVPLRENRRRVFYPYLPDNGLQWRAPSIKLPSN